MRLFFILIFFGQMLKIESCTEKTNTAPAAETAFLGEYVLKSKFLGDAIDTPCGYEANFKGEITLNIKKSEDGKGLSINGDFPVNMYFGKMTIGSKIKETDIYELNVEGLGSSKRGGPPELMACETYLFDFILNAPEIRLSEDNQLHVGTFKKDNVPSRDGGTYLIFERKSKL